VSGGDLRGPADPDAAPAIELPRIDPVGIARFPAGYRGAACPRPWPVRLAAVALLAAFLAVGTATTVATLGRFCLTTQAGSPIPRAPGPHGR
jgi:hypothetical protein